MTTAAFDEFFGDVVDDSTEIDFTDYLDHASSTSRDQRSALHELTPEALSLHQHHSPSTTVTTDTAAAEFWGRGRRLRARRRRFRS